MRDLTLREERKENVVNEKLDTERRKRRRTW